MLKKVTLTLLLLGLAVLAAAQDLRVSDVQVEGIIRVETSVVLAEISIEPGDLVTPEDIDRAMQNIFKLGYFDDISADMTEVQGAKILTFVVHELPLIRHIKFSGNDKLKKDKLRPLIKLRAPSIYNRSKIEASLKEIKNAYIEDGYYAAKIEADLQVDDKNEATLTFEIVEGKKVLIRDISFVGNIAFDKDELIDKMETKERWFLSWITDRGVYNKDTMLLDIERIKAAYHDKGYQYVKVKQPQVSLVDDDKYLDVVIEIDPGIQYKVGKVIVSGDLMYPQEKMLRLVRLKSGDIFSTAELRDTILVLTDVYADNGYAYTNVTPLTSRVKGQQLIDLNLEVEQGPRVFVERIEITGNTKTRDKVIRREIPLLEGDLFRAQGVKEAKRRVRNLGFFDEVTVTNKPGSDEAKTILGVAVTERPTGTFSVGVGYSSVDSFMVQGSISQENLFGYGLRLSLSGSFGSKSTNYSLGLSDPHFLDTDWTLGGEIYNNYREYNDYDEEKIGGSVRAGHPIGRKSKLYVTYRLEKVDVSDIDSGLTETIQDEEGNSTLSSITTQIVRNSTDYYDDPSRGGVTHLSLEFAGLGGTEHFLKPLAEHRHFFSLPWGHVFSIHGETGYVTSTNSDDVSITQKFFLGGIRTIRGFNYREVGPRENGDYVGGPKMGYFNFEYIFPIYKKLGLKGVLFYDTGNAWAEDENYFSSMRHGAGFEIRWKSPMGPLRFAWGRNLSPKDYEDNSVFEFTIGKAF
jgi:outer membrane protein insertion porin family